MKDASQQDPLSGQTEAPLGRESSRRLIVGLGNPGEKYEASRHNYGFLVVDALAQRWGASERELCAASFFANADIDSEDGEEAVSARFADLAKPQTFMNRSGLSVRCLAQRFGYSPDHVLVVYDDISLPLGKQRMRARGSAGGHRGLESVIENLRTDEVPRLRLGIAPAPEPSSDEVGQSALERATNSDGLVDFVLGDFDDSERPRVSLCVNWAADACEAWLRYGIDHTMSQFNGSLPEGEN